MERKLPKNIRQIGNVSDNPKVYVEDYVDTFITQMCEKAKESPVGAFLIGETFRKDEQDYIFIHGAVQMEDVSMKGNEVIIGDRTWKKACEKGKHYFAGNTILGWMLLSPNLSLKLNANIMKLHERLFMKKSRMLILKDSVDKEEAFFVYKYNDLMEIGRHYIYYEKNPEMQDYMIANRKQNCVTPSESYEDRVTKDFRSVINQKSDARANSKKNTKSYAASIALVLVVLVMGITAMNDYEELEMLQTVMGHVAGTFANAEEDGSEDSVDVAAQSTYVVVSDGNSQEDNAEGEDVGEEVTGEDVGEEAMGEEVGVAPNIDESEGDESVLAENQEENQEENTSSQLQMPQGDSDTIIGAQYIVKENDTLVQISMEYYETLYMVEEICALNNLEDSDYIYVGQVLLLP